MPSERKLIKCIVNALKKNQRRKRRRRRRSRRSRSLSRSSQSSSLSAESARKSRTPSPDYRRNINLEGPIIELEDPDITETEPSNPYKEALGMEYEEPIKYTGQIHTDIDKKLNHILTTGLTKEERDVITKKHTVPDNCTLLDAPLLNPEVKAVLTESSKLRDQGIEISQRQIGLATSITSKAITDLILNENTDKHKLLSDLADATKILTDVHYHQTRTRIKLISPLLDKNFNQIISKTKRDHFLYGENLPELLKNVKQMEQAAAQIKKPLPPAPTNNRPATNNTQRPNPGNRNGPPPKTTKMNARGGPPRTTQASDHQRPRAYQRHHRSERVTYPQSRHKNASTKR